MKNSTIANIFYDIADLLELKNENHFKVLAYQKAGRAIELWSKELEDMVREGEDLCSIPGVGDAIAGKIKDLVTAGHLELYDRLLKEFPQGITGLLHIPGVGPKTAARLASELDLRTIDDLEQALMDGRVAGLKGMGETSAAKILAQVQALRSRDRRIPIGVALPISDQIVAGLRAVKGLRYVSPVGSMRRHKETVGDITILASADNPQEVIDTFTGFPFVYHVVEKSPDKASVIVGGGNRIDLRMMDTENFGSMLRYYTGSREHNDAFKDRFERLGFRVDQDGISGASTETREKFETEEDLYRRLGLQFIPPELRENRGEIEAAAAGTLPVLIEAGDIKGDLHVHSDWSDGKLSLEEIAQEAVKRGYQYIAITDHSHALGIARGLDPERLLAQISEIERLNQQYPGFRVFSGIEVDIRADGRLDLADDILSRLEVVVASVHSAMNQPQQEITTRVIMAMENPHVDILAHPTCRIIGGREPTALDMEAVFQAALRTGTALEINATPQRLDLKDTHAYRARQLGVTLVISTDAHKPAQFDFMRYGVGLARRAWCQAGNVLNTLNSRQILDFMRDHKKVA